MIFTSGSLGIWALVDFIMAVSGSMTDNEGRLVKSWNPSGLKHATQLPTTAGILSIVAGAIGLIAVTTAATIGTLTATNILIGFGLISVPRIIFGILAIVGGVFALQRRIWVLALIGAIFALLSVWWLGVLAIIFAVISQKEFARS